MAARSESYYNVYHLETKVLEEISQRLLERKTLPAVTADVDMDAYDRKVINIFCDKEGRIRRFPAQQKKFEAVLRYVARDFEAEQCYSEHEATKSYRDFQTTLHLCGGDSWNTS